jgi:lipopolysaccharide transport system ATP-binding protein
MSDIAIEFDHVGKLYRLKNVGSGTLSHDLNRWWQMRVLGHNDPFLKVGEVNDRAHKGASDYVWALKDIDFTVKQGEVVGIIGKNGAGKSTLLKLLSRVTGPTVGEIRTRGRIASLLEVGTGFHPEMTGRENIYMNGAIMGMTKAEIGRKLDEIVDFAGVERYLDTPVKRYSSGMTVRLGFAVAAFLEPEILVVDEVLAVGDAEFQKKAIGRMQDVSKGEGRTVLFVSHNMASVRQLCSEGLLLEKGQLVFRGNILDTIAKYLGPNPEALSVSLEKRTDRIGNGKIRLLSIIFRNASNNSVDCVFSGDYLKIEFHVDIQADVDLGQLRVGCAFEDGFQNYSTQWASDEMFQDFSKMKDGTFSLEIPHLNLRPNTYYLYVQISLGSTHAKDFCDVLHGAAAIQVVSAPFFDNNLLVKPNRGHMALLEAKFVL